MSQLQKKCTILFLHNFRRFHGHILSLVLLGPPLRTLAWREKNVKTIKTKKKLKEKNELVNSNNNNNNSAKCIKFTEAQYSTKAEN